MRKIPLILMVMCLCLMAACNAIEQNSSLFAEHDCTGSAYGVPDAMKQFSENPDTQWMAGMWVTIKNSTLLHTNSPENFEILSDPGELIQATVIVQNGLNLTQNYYLMVFADGIPVEFRIDGEPWISYPVELTPQRKPINIEFAKEFSLNLGRLDFVLLFDEDPLADHFLASYTVWIDFDKEPQYPTSLCPMVEQREGLQGSYSSGAYNAWLWNESIVPLNTDNTGPRSISLQEGETILLEAIASRPGLYRTVLIVDGIPMGFESNGKHYTYFDWKSAGIDMLQLPVELNAIPSTGSIYTITTPLDTETLSLFIVASGKIEIIANGKE